MAREGRGNVGSETGTGADSRASRAERGDLRRQGARKGDGRKTGGGCCVVLRRDVMESPVRHAASGACAGPGRSQANGTRTSFARSLIALYGPTLSCVQPLRPRLMLPLIRLQTARVIRGTPPREQASPLQLCRALLRQASYLPDQTARDYFRGFILSRWRSYQPRESGARPYRETNNRRKPHPRLSTANINLRTAENLRKARKALSLLHRANNGEIAALRTVLHAAYGRTGRRRHELIQPLLQDALSVDTRQKKIAGRDKKPLQKLYHDNSRVLSFFDAPVPLDPSRVEISISKEYAKLDAVIKANAKYRPQNSPRHRIRSTSLVAPTTNIWGRPMPIKRSKNKVREWYKIAMEKLLPPLPEDEFNRLQGLALGDIKWELVSRRPTGTVRSETADVEGVPSPDVSSPESELERTKHRLLYGLYPPRHTPTNIGDDNGRNRITPRFMRGMYEDIAILCSKAVWDERWGKWTIIWGSLVTKERLRRLWTRPAGTDLFSGVDEFGKLTKPARPEPQRKEAAEKPGKDEKPHSHSNGRESKSGPAQ